MRMRQLLPGLLGALASCSGLIRVPDLPPVPEEVLDRAFAPEDLAADVESLFQVIEEVHPDPYGERSREDVLAAKRALIDGLDRPLTRREFQPRLAALVATLGDGHTAVHPPFEEFWCEERCFPVDVALEDGGLFVRRTAVVTPDGALGPGARLIEVAGRSATELFESFLAREGGETRARREDGVERHFAVHLWLEGIDAPYPAKFASALDPAVEFGIELPGMPWGAVARGDAPGGGERWRLERREDGVAVLTIDTLAGSLGEFEDFLERTFDSLASAPPTGLVVDLRRNGGGDSRLGDELLQYLSDRPWRQCARKEWKVSGRLKQHLKSLLPAWIRWLPVQYLHPTSRAVWRTPEGEIAVFDEDPTEPRDEPLRYRGPLAWLVGPGTFSAAVGLVAGARDCGRGLLVGAETGGLRNGFGEVYPFRLPATRLAAQVSTARFVGPGGDPADRGGLRPDVPVLSSAGDAGDPVLEAAAAAVGNRKDPDRAGTPTGGSR